MAIKCQVQKGEVPADIAHFLLNAALMEPLVTFSNGHNHSGVSLRKTIQQVMYLNILKTEEKKRK